MSGLLSYIQENKMSPGEIRSALLRAYVARHKVDGVKFKARFLKDTAGDDIHKKETAFQEICTTLTGITNAMLQDEYIKIVAGIMEVKQAILSKKIKNEVDAKVDSKKQAEDLKRVRYVVEQAERKEVDMSAGDGDYLIILEALASFGESGRDYFHRIASLRPEYIRPHVDPDFTEALKGKKVKNPYKFFKIADMYGLEVKLPKTIKEAKEKATAQDIIGDDDMVYDYQTFGIWEEGGVYKSLDQYDKPYTVSNFKMKILWHVETADDAAYRFIAIENVYHKKAVINMNTDNFVSLGTFKKEVARKGNFIWKGNDVDLTRLQEKLQEDEKSTDLIQNLGWQKRGKIYAFANGIYDVAEDTFLPVDEYGIVEHYTISKEDERKQKNYFIPALSKIYIEKDEKYANDKKFIYQDSKINFETWSKQYCKVFGDHGNITMMFYVMCIFSDIVFKDMGRRFPILFAYGKRGSGKGQLIQSTMRMFGLGQDQIMLGGASTTPAFMRKAAQFINAIFWLDEYKNNLLAKIIESLKNIYDRIGYERAKKDHSFETEGIPVNSGLILSGQEMPTIEPALFTRTILLALTKTKFSQEERDALKILERMEEGGLSCITVSLMKYRPLFADKFKITYQEELSNFTKFVNNNEIDERLYMSYAAMIAAAELINNVLPLPFNMNAFRDLMKRNLLEQFFVLKGSDDASKFWDVVEGLFNTGQLVEDKHFILKNGYLYIRVGDVHQQYAETLIKRRDPNVLDQQTLYKYLESDTKSFVKRDKKWFQGQRAQLWCHQFKYSELNVDLIQGVDEADVKRRYKEMGVVYIDDAGDQAEMDLKVKTDEPKVDPWDEE